MKPRADQLAESERICVACILVLLVLLAVDFALATHLRWWARLAGAWACVSLPVAVCVGAWLRWNGRFDRG